MRAGAEGRAGELETQAHRQIVLAFVSTPEPIVERISELTIEIRHALETHPDGEIFRSLFIAKDSWLTAATMLAEIGDRPDRYPTYRALAGPRTFTPERKPAARPTRTPAASSDGPGAKSSGGSGTTTTPTSRPNTPPARN